MIPHLSFRYRIPINLAAAALGTALLISGFVLWHDIRSIHHDADFAGNQLGLLLANTLAKDLAIDDQWQAYLDLTAPFRDNRENWLLPAFAVVIDGNGKTLVSSDPQRFPLALSATALKAYLPSILDKAAHANSQYAQLERDHFHFHIRQIRSNSQYLATLVLGFENQRLWPRYLLSTQQIAIGTALSILLLLPLGWWLGRRLARPLTELQQCVTRWADQSGNEEATQCAVENHHGEFGLLAQRIQQVSQQLSERKQIEKQLAHTERQAALGRLAAGIAHEINNPLGGMLTAIAINKRHGHDPTVAKDTMDLIERGLQQIRGIVAALLVEVKPEERTLEPKDVQDIARLLGTKLREKGLDLAIEDAGWEHMQLPAGPIRQVLLNLLLNAIQASPENAPIHLYLQGDTDQLGVRISNTGPPIPADQQQRLFEPLVGNNPDGNGLGLWISDQIVHRLGGKIQLHSTTEQTVFEVCIPWEKSNESR